MRNLYWLVLILFSFSCDKWSANVRSSPSPIVAENFTAVAGTNQTYIITFRYNHVSYPAATCEIKDLSNVTISNPCTCTDGVCKVGVTGVARGIGSFKYILKDAKYSSNPGVVTLNVLGCPDGYIALVNEFNDANFCVMKYEAKAQLMTANVPGAIKAMGCDAIPNTDHVSTCTANWAGNVYHHTNNTTGYRPVSVPEGKPWRRIQGSLTGGGDTVSARAACLGLGTGYDLISNEEWMSIARNIEKNPINWSSGIIGNGFIPRGHSDNNPAFSCDGLHSNVDTDCSTTGNTPNQKRTLVVGEGVEIWDFAGNVWEWVYWSADPDQQLGPTSCTGGPIQLKDANCVALMDDDFMPLDPTHDSTFGMGRFYGGVGGHAIRGGFYDFGDVAGIYALNLQSGPTTTNNTRGFRCVFRP